MKQKTETFACGHLQNGLTTKIDDTLYHVDYNRTHHV